MDPPHKGGVLSAGLMWIIMYRPRWHRTDVGGAMGNRHPSPQWDRLGSEVLNALDHWLSGTSFELACDGWLPTRPGATPVGLVVRSGTGRTRKLVMKFCDAPDRAEAFHRALGEAPPAFRTRHLVPIE